MKRDDLHWKRLGSINEKESIIHGLRQIAGIGCNIPSLFVTWLYFG